MSAQLTYHREGDYMIPNLIAPEAGSIGTWGRRRREYLEKHRNGIYTGMLLSGKLDAYLAEIDRQADEMFRRLTRQMAADSPASPIPIPAPKAAIMYQIHSIPDTSLF